MKNTNNPVEDMEDYERRVEEENARREVFGYCEHCGNAIYKASDCYDGDEYVPVADGVIHVDCMRAWTAANRKEAV